jgi:hypothetical protein
MNSLLFVKDKITRKQYLSVHFETTWIEKKTSGSKMNFKCIYSEQLSKTLDVDIKYKI